MIDKEAAKAALRPDELRQYAKLLEILNEKGIFTTTQQKKWDQYRTTIEEYKLSNIEKSIDNENVSGVVPILVTTKQICQLFRITIQNLSTEWPKNPTFPKDAKIGHNKWNFAVLFAWWYQYFHLSDENAASLASEKVRYQRARARREELVVGELEGRLVDVAQVIDELSFVNTVKRQALLLWSKRLPGVLENKNHKQISRVIDAEVRHILSEYSKGVRNLQKVIKKIGKDKARESTKADNAND